MLLLVRAVGDENNKIVAIVRCSNLILTHLSHVLPS